MRTPRAWISACLLPLLSLCLLFFGCSRPAAAFTVDGLAVEKAELIHYMREYSAVAAAALENQGLDSTRDDFWTTTQNGVDTFAYLKDYTTQQLVRLKVEQQCAKKQGVDTPLYYSDQLEAWHEQNRQRASAYAAGEVLYGPVERDFIAYFQEWYLEMEQQSMTALYENGTLSVSVSEVETVYKENEALYAEYTREQALYIIRGELLEKAYEAYIDTLAAKAVIKEGEAQIRPEEVF